LLVFLVSYSVGDARAHARRHGDITSLFFVYSTISLPIDYFSSHYLFLYFNRRTAMSTKSFGTSGSANPIITYCTSLSVRPHPLQVQLQDETLKRSKGSGMLGAPEVSCETISKYLFN
jgi:hypothetical protein